METLEDSANFFLIGCPFRSRVRVGSVGGGIEGFLKRHEVGV